MIKEMTGPYGKTGMGLNIQCTEEVCSPADVMVYMIILFPGQQTARRIIRELQILNL